MKGICFIETAGEIRRIAPHVYESSMWVLSEKRTEELLGKNVWFHKSRISPSFFGGIIKSFRRQEDGPCKGRWHITFEVKEGCGRGFDASSAAWAQEKALIY